jgi:hypothetical protein
LLDEDEGPARHDVMSHVGKGIDLEHNVTAGVVAVRVEVPRAEDYLEGRRRRALPSTDATRTGERIMRSALISIFCWNSSGSEPTLGEPRSTGSRRKGSALLMCWGTIQSLNLATDDADLPLPQPAVTVPQGQCGVSLRLVRSSLEHHGPPYRLSTGSMSRSTRRYARHPGLKDIAIACTGIGAVRRHLAKCGAHGTSL